MCVCVCVCGWVCVCVDVFSQVSDSSGVLLLSKFDWYLREALKLPSAVHVGPSFSYTHTSARACFPQQVHTQKILCTGAVFYFLSYYYYSSNRMLVSKCVCVCVCVCV